MAFQHNERMQTQTCASTKSSLHRCSAVRTKNDEKPLQILHETRVTTVLSPSMIFQAAYRLKVAHISPLMKAVTDHNGAARRPHRPHSVTSFSLCSHHVIGRLHAAAELVTARLTQINQLNSSYHCRLNRQNLMPRALFGDA
jgi:hypothetical protein